MDVLKTKEGKKKKKKGKRMARPRLVLHLANVRR